MLKVLLAALVAFSALTTVAEAAKPPLSLDRADRAAQREAVSHVKLWNEYEAENRAEKAEILEACLQHPNECVPELDITLNEPDGPYILGYELDSCGRVGRSRADCDITYWLDNGNGCDSAVIVRTTRRNRLNVQSDDLVCDGDEEDFDL